VPRLTGAGSSWPFLYQGMEHEITDPAPLYFDHGANVYNPMLQRELSQLGPQGSAGPPTAGAAEGGMGKGFGGFGPSQCFGNPGGLSGGRIASNLLTVAHAPFLFGQGGIGVGEAGPLPIPGVGAADEVFSWLDGLFNAADSPEIPREKQHRRHPVYRDILGVSEGLTPSQDAGRPLTDCEKAALAPYIPEVDLNSARIHSNGLPWYTRIFPSVVGTTPPGTSDIYFKRGAYDPGTPEGLALLGHELVHVGQWRTEPSTGIMIYLLHSGRYETPAYALQMRIQDDLINKGSRCCK
jgi:hypothetical protein